MKIAIVHYHFDRGGVTSVVRSILRGLRDNSDVEFGLLSGRPMEDMEAPGKVIPGLDYNAKTNSKDLYKEVLASARKLFSNKLPDVWHIHNPTLGKNGTMIGLVAELARNGHPLLLHQHDFAEDFRPTNYQLRESHRSKRDPVFPYSSHVRFATINGRDCRILQKAGMPASYALSLPNPIESQPVDAEDGENHSLLLYPVRGLPRKNFGEILLLAGLLRDKYEFATTLPPTNKKNVALFERWEKLSQKLKLPVRLAVARDKKEKLETWIRRSGGIITTSVAEGFGLSFLEAWMQNRPVCGRDLPEITQEFRLQGLQLDHLYSSLDIPIEVFPLDRVRRNLKDGILKTYHLYRNKIKESYIDEWVHSLGTNGHLDFAYLSAEEQESVIRKLVSGSTTGLSVQMNLETARKHLKKNRSIIEQKYSIAAYTRRLVSIYHEISGASAAKLNTANEEIVLTGFLDVKRYRPQYL